MLRSFRMEEVSRPRATLQSMNFSGMRTKRAPIGEATSRMLREQ